MDLLKLDLLRRFRKTRSKDPLLAEVALVRKVIQVLSKRRKTLLSQINPLDPGDPVYLELLKLHPSDALLICAEHHYPLPFSVLSLALQVPEESLRHRKSQLEARFKAQELDLDRIRLLGDETLTQSRLRNRGMITRFHNLPMAIRFTIETSLVLGFLLGLLWVIPEIRNLYEATIQKSINEYLIESALLDSPAPEGTSQTPRDPLAAAPGTGEGSTEGSTEPLEPQPDKSSSDAPSPKRQPRVNEGETWRFSFTGSATQEIQTSILQTLKQMQVEGAKPTGVPGGIQFDFDLRTEALLDLKGRLESSISDLQKKARSAQSTAPAYANMSWYKKRNMGARKIPGGHVQVIVWISTI